MKSTKYIPLQNLGTTNKRSLFWNNPFYSLEKAATNLTDITGFQWQVVKAQDMQQEILSASILKTNYWLAGVACDAEGIKKYINETTGLSVEVSQVNKQNGFIAKIIDPFDLEILRNGPIKVPKIADNNGEENFSEQKSACCIIV